MGFNEEKISRFIKSETQLQALRKDFETLQIKDGESVTSYCSKTMGIANNMRFHGEKMEDVAIVEKILHPLALRYDYIVCLSEESKDIDTLSLDELQSSLLVHEQKINRSTTIDEQALKASTYAQSSNSRGRGRGRGKGKGGQSNRDGSRQYSEATNDQSVVYGRGRGHEFEKSKIECYRCHKFGHHRSECYTKLPADTEKREKSNFAEN
nr:uncharacterized protein LOC125423226 [Ziziphus jujuba var. spinosa]